MRVTRVTIVRQDSMGDQTINNLLLLLGQSLGLFGHRDKDKSCYRIFIILVRALQAKVQLTSDDLANQTGLSRGTVIHHLNRMMDAGIVTNFRNKYFINYASLEDLVEDLRKGVNEVFDDMAELAVRIDEGLKF
jgi:predicted transcriptional regulator